MKYFRGLGYRSPIKILAPEYQKKKKESLFTSKGNLILKMIIMVLTTKKNVVVHTYNSTWEVKARGSEVQGQSDLNKITSRKKRGGDEDEKEKEEKNMGNGKKTN